jgi:hypothetical protein
MKGKFLGRADAPFGTANSAEEIAIASERRWIAWVRLLRAPITTNFLFGRDLSIIGTTEGF